MTIAQNNARFLPLADKSVHCVVTSPPYWGLRDYQIAGQLGLEQTPDEYVTNMVEVFREVRRVMRDDAVCFINLGDSYQDKQLQGIPWRVAFALQADGWYLRSDIIWAKPNPMPESVTDRPTKAHEYLFLLSKRPQYYYDAEAVREGAKYGRRSTFRSTSYENNISMQNGAKRRKPITNNSSDPAAGRNRRTVWTIATQPYSGAHFATFPEALVEPCIKAGTSEHGVCAECGAPWERVTETIGKSLSVEERHGRVGHNGQPPQISGYYWTGPTTKVTNTWRPTCNHDAPTVPATVLDIFGGSGTTKLVARHLKRDAVVLDLSFEYLQLARQRLELDTLDAWNSGKSIASNNSLANLPLFEL